MRGSAEAGGVGARRRACHLCRPRCGARRRRVARRAPMLRCASWPHRRAARSTLPRLAGGVCASLPSGHPLPFVKGRGWCTERESVTLVESYVYRKVGRSSRLPFACSATSGTTSPCAPSPLDDRPHFQTPPPPPPTLARHRPKTGTLMSRATPASLLCFCPPTHRTHPHSPHQTHTRSHPLSPTWATAGRTQSTRHRSHTPPPTSCQSPRRSRACGRPP